MEHQPDNEPIYVISVAARLVEMHPQTLRYYERAGLLKPTRSSGKIRLYSPREIEQLRRIQRLTELGVNLAGVEMIIDLMERMEQLREEMAQRERVLREEMEQREREVHEESDRLRKQLEAHSRPPRTIR
ncbi:MAG: MerR family transcriptional regulator [Chloroflexi bacterium]|nr:MerR family transcriptional regulator [Chloroflexota bacterium]